mgnify:CR=1 FL=1
MKLSYILFLSTALFCSCEKFLDTPPASQLGAAAFWKTSGNAELGVAAIYDACQTAFRQEFWRWGELRADNFGKNERPETNIQQVLDDGLTPSTASADWGNIYKAIATANVAIARIPTIPSFSGQNNLLAEAHALRALLYFYAVRVWGNVPKVTEPVEDLGGDLNVSRSPVEEIYNEIIIPDIEKAEGWMTTQRSLKYISLGSILALKAHVFMWPGSHRNYNTAIDAITRLESFGYRLETTQSGWIDIFRGAQTSNEIVFGLSWNYTEDGANGISQFVNNSPKLVPREELETKWQSIIPGDFRTLITAAFDIEVVNVQAFPPLRVLTKYSGKFDDRNVQQVWGTTTDRSIPFFRLSELVLLKAEAENGRDHPEDALKLVNRIRAARQLPAVDENITDKATVRDMILDERQFELMGEGQRYWDLVRNGVVFEVMGPINGMNDPRKILWPVSQNVLNRNPNIQQNEGY